MYQQSICCARQRHRGAPGRWPCPCPCPYPCPRLRHCPHTRQGQAEHPSPAHHRDCDRKLHCTRGGTTGTQLFLRGHWVRVSRVYGTSNQRPHTPHPRQWRHRVGSRHEQYWTSDCRTVYERIIPSNWQCCSQTKWKSRHHGKNSVSTWQTAFEQ